MIYKGYSEITLSDEDLAKFYSNKLNFEGVFDNSYLVIKNEAGDIVDKLCYQNGEFRKVYYKTISNDYMGEIKPRNLQQEFFFDMLQDKRTKIKVVTGRFGTGKSMGMIAQALTALQKGIFQKIVYIRNNINAKDTTELGAIPGTQIEKLKPYLMVLSDHLGGEDALDSYIESGRIEPIHLGFLRGRDLRNSLIYITEAQNLTKSQMQLLIGRVGEGSELWIDGDEKQTDKKVFEDNNGLRALVEKLKGNEYFGYINLVKSERSAVASLADLLD